MENYRKFLLLLALSVLIGFVSVLFVLVWVFKWREGLGWDGGAAEFNWHPVLAVTGFIFIQGIAIVVYRLPWTWRCSKPMMKSIHAGLNALAFTLMVISAVAVFDFHNAKNIPDMYSLHSWIGLLVVILHSIQLLLGVCIYLLPSAPAFIRTAAMPLHVYSGIFIFGAAVATALMGITEKLIFSLKDPPYKNSPPEAVFVNMLGLFIVVYGALILWMVTRPQWKRPGEQTSATRESAANEEDSTMAENGAFGNANVEHGGDTRKRNLKVDEMGQRSTM
ncbi:plasma membrane ascorbate-dependent reductase CYBRD1 [Erpetoichthys calabaricus]|uniref:Plasma membrane ascorbate-dependent reductase CYBRD1 n=1 Tax=Erpetoichthys calabaricus TaxID=27687 RepID=A0A8C4SA00_ERPCA|nr:plasma membrane ascorbate-dependent reductase CYBRD1 [Erpetoichthys calabaricus]